MTQRRKFQSWHGTRDVERFRAAGLWGDQTLADVVDSHAARTPGKLAVADGSLRWNYGEFTELSKRLAAVLDGWGVGPECAVAAQLPNSAALPLIHLACNRIGAVFLPMSPAWRRSETQSLLSVTEAVVHIGGLRESAGEVIEAPSVKVALPLADLLELLRDAAPITDERAVALHPDANAVAHAMVSSGTTGVPKAALWSSNNLLTFLAHQTADALQMTTDDVAGALAPASLGSTGYVFPVLAPLLVGASSVILEHWEPEAALDLLVRERCTYLTAVPTQLVDLLDVPVEDYDLAALTRVNNAGAPLAAGTAEQIEARMQCRVQTVYGASDGGVPVMTSIDDPDRQRLSSVGRVLPGQELRLVDSEGAPVPEGEVGEIWWRGANKSYGYFNQPDYDAGAFTEDAWFRSGDLGSLDAEGYLRIVGRSNDMILRGGLNIFPQEVELLLHELPSVTAAVVVGVPDSRLGERACAVIVPAGDPPSLQDLTAFLDEREIAQFKHPEFLVIAERLPVNAGGKVDRRKLAQIAASELHPES